MTPARPWPLPIPGIRRAWWLREALATEAAAGHVAPAPALRGETTAEVAIIGGGYTGMWTAYFLTERAPDMRIVLLEEDICGGGPSGRNGGFVHGWWEQLPYLVKRYGLKAGFEIADAADEVVDGIGEWCARHGVDAWYRKAGYLAAHAFPAVDSGFEATAAKVAQLGAGGQLAAWDGAAVQEVCASPAFRDGLWMPSAASIQPARLARGLRRVLLERGVTIHENTHVSRLDAYAGTGAGQPRVRIWTDKGSVRAHQAVLAVNAWLAGWPGHRLRLLAWGSYMVITEPIPDRLQALGWTGGELLSDTRFTISYFRTTHDGRIAFGAGVGAAGFDGRIGPSFTHDRQAIARVVANFDHLFPTLGDVRFEDAWGGPIDITADRFPVIGSRDGGRVHYAYGFSGNGAGPARLAGRVLAALVDDPFDPLARLAFVGRRQRILPPEPFRYVGARVIREALIRRDDALDAGRRPGLLVRVLARVPSLLGYRFEH
ncbi:MAG: NAD(P)/FAD-dependent oxidoreductase [Candidatus Limnocylindria bacterium]